MMDLIKEKEESKKKYCIISNSEFFNNSYIGNADNCGRVSANGELASCCSYCNQHHYYDWRYCRRLCP